MTLTTASRARMIQGAPVFAAPDVPAALEFYRSRLGFEQTYLAPDGSYGVIAREGFELRFSHTGQHDPGMAWECHVRVEGIEVLYAEFLAQGVVHPHGHLQAHPWGRSFSILDLNNYNITFSQFSE